MSNRKRLLMVIAMSLTFFLFVSLNAYATGEVKILKDTGQISKFALIQLAQSADDDKDNNTKAGSRKMLEPSEVSALVSPAVGYIETFDKENNPIGNGSCFIVDSSGKVVTNYHVIHGAYTAIIKLSDGKTYNVINVCTYDQKRDIAILKIKGSNLPVVKLGDSGKIVSGQKILTIGSPLGYENTIADGLISSTSRTLEDGNKYIQVSAPISPGSSGGVLLNYYSEVIGVTTSGRVDGQNLNFAIPINDVKSMLSVDKEKTLEQVYKEVEPHAELEKYLNENFSSCTLDDGGNIISDLIVVSENKDYPDYIVVIYYLFADNHSKFLDSIAKDNKNAKISIENWMKKVYKEAAKKYPNMKVYVELTYADIFEAKPDEAPDREIVYNSEKGTWTVFNSEMYIIYEKGKDLILQWQLDKK